MGDATDAAQEQANQHDENTPDADMARADEEPRWRGERLGLPEYGPGSAAPAWRRVAAFFLDLILAALIAALFTFPDPPENWSLLAWVLITVLPVSFAGFTPGMAVVGIWVARLDGKVMVGLPKAALRCVLTGLLIPAMVFNLDGRSWTDRLSRTLVLRR